MTAKSLSEFLPDGAIVTNAHAIDWRAAVQLAGDALVAQGATTAAYTDEMIKAIEDLGPYVVVAPGFALAHSRPSPAVLHIGLSWIALAQPVNFGSKENDPVRLVVGLAALDHDSHIDIMSALAEVLSSDDKLAAALAATTPTQVRKVLSKERPTK